MTVKFEGKTYKIPATPTYFKNGAYIAGAAEKYLNSLKKGYGHKYAMRRRINDKKMNKQKWIT